jgi:hypothetical protein
MKTMTEDQKTQALELMKQFATAAKAYDPLIVMSVLEAAMTAEIYRQDQLVGQLFEEMMSDFKGEAAVLLGVSMLMKAAKKAKDTQAASTCPTCGDTAEESKIASFACHDPFHKTIEGTQAAQA